MFTVDNYFLQLLAWSLLHFAWQGSFLAISLRVCDSVLRGSTSSLRYRVFCAHLAALVIAPCMTLIVSHVALTGIGMAEMSGTLGFFALLLVWSRPLLLPVLHFLVMVLPCILILWIMGVLVGGCLVLRGHTRHRRLQRSYTVSDVLSNVIDDLTRKLGIVSCLTVLEADTASPFVVGTWRPRLVLPRKIEQVLTRDELRAILAHELAHVKRSDYRSNLFQVLVLVLFWPHPATWAVWMHIRREREICCDDLAVQLCGSPVNLAHALYHLALKGPRFDVAMAATKGSLEARIQRLLTHRHLSSRSILTAVPILAMAALAVSTALLAQALKTDESARIALLASPLGPTISIQAHDPAGLFFVRLRRGRVLGVSIGNERISSADVLQQGNSVRVIGRSGQELLAIQIDPRGGIAWQPRIKQDQPDLK